MIRKIFSVRLKALRKTAGLTQTQLAEALGLNRANIDSYERGMNFTEPEKFLAIAEYFHVTTDYLLGRTEDPHRTIIEVPNDKIA